MTLFWYSQNLLCAINKWFQINSLVKINLANFTKNHSSFSTKVMNKWKFNHVNNDFSRADARIFLNEGLESTLLNFRVRVKSESLKKMWLQSIWVRFMTLTRPSMLFSGFFDNTTFGNQWFNRMDWYNTI
jgi:hypothetical protein